MEQPIVEFKQICKQYDAGVPVISDLNLAIEKGEFICIVGPSGCGKSTLLHMLGGFFDATSGEIFIDGKKVLQPSRDCGIVFQDCSIPNAKNILDTVALGEEVEKMSLIERFIPFWYNYRRKDILGRARAMLKKVGLENDFHKFPSQLSGGQKQRVAIARALLKQPKVLLMDEPFSALDPQTRTVLQLLMLDIQRETKTTTFFVTHSIDEAVFLADRVVVLSQYHKQGQGSRIVHIESIESFSDIEAKKSANYAETIARIKEAGFSANQADEIERRQKHLKKLSEMEVFNAT